MRNLSFSFMSSAGTKWKRQCRERESGLYLSLPACQNGEFESVCFEHWCTAWILRDEGMLYGETSDHGNCRLSFAALPKSLPARAKGNLISMICYRVPCLQYPPEIRKKQNLSRRFHLRHFSQSLNTGNPRRSLCVKIGAPYVHSGKHVHRKDIPQ